MEDTENKEQVQETETQEQVQTETVETKNTETKNTETHEDAFNVDDEDLYKELDGIAPGRMKRFVKSIVKEKGGTQEQADQVWNKYEAKLNERKNKDTDTISNLTKQNKELQDKVFSMELDRAVAKAAADLGIRSDRIDKVVKLAELNNVADDGKINQDKVNEAIQSVLNDIPEFKCSGEQKTVQVRKVGADKEEKKVLSAEEEFKRAIGLIK